MEQPSMKKRLDLLDLLRGITLISMIGYHLCFDLMYLFGVNMPWFTSSAAGYWQESIAMTFILLSGISSNLSHNNIRRGTQIFLLSLLLSLGTYLILPEELIVFGILHFMGFACILTGILKKLMNKIPAWSGFVICAILFLLTKGINNGFLGIGNITLISLPKTWYQIPGMFLLGFPGTDFVSSDYFSIFPWIFLFWTGFFLWKLIGAKIRTLSCCTWKLPIINCIGRHTLLIYMIHQPIIYSILFLLAKTNVL